MLQVTPYNSEWNFEGILSYNNTFGDFVVSANVGANRLNIRNRAVAMNTNNGLNVPGLYAIANSKAVPSISNSRSDQQANSLFVFGDVEYKKFLSLTYAVRNDWFSTLPSHQTIHCCLLQLVVHLYSLSLLRVHCLG
jgi:hypothetical protein